MVRLPLRPALLLLLAASTARAAVHEVGPGRPLATLGEVPWESLDPGDTVVVHWRPAPYREKFVIARRGEPGAPITVRGMPGPGGERPVISGDGATTRPQLDYWNEERGVIKVGGASVPPETAPAFIVIEGLEVRSAHESYAFTDDRGNAASYSRNAAAIYVEKCDGLVIRDCELHDSGNGLFIGSPATDPTTDVLIEGNWLHDNGNVGSAFEHGSYTQALGIVVQANHYGPMRPGAEGNNLKDRSAGLVVRYNWIVGGNRQLDLVDAGVGSLIEQDPSYRTTLVYGNVLVETEGAGNRQVVHYGGDGGQTAGYRKGLLHFYGNTVLSERSDRTTLFRLSTVDERCDARNNLVHLTAAAGSALELLSDAGTLDWTHSWLPVGWTFTFFGTAGTFNDAGTTLDGDDPGLVDAAARELALRADSPCRDAGTGLHPDVAAEHPVSLQPVAPLSAVPRPVDGAVDLGAIEHASLPGEAMDLRLEGTRLDWTAAQAATTHELLRGDLARLATGSLADSAVGCSPGLGVTATDDAPLPASGRAWYLVRGRNAAGPGTWGPAGRDAMLASPAGCP